MLLADEVSWPQAFQSVGEVFAIALIVIAIMYFSSR